MDILMLVVAFVGLGLLFWGVTKWSSTPTKPELISKVKKTYILLGDVTPEIYIKTDEELQALDSDQLAYLLDALKMHYTYTDYNRNYKPLPEFQAPTPNYQIPPFIYIWKIVSLGMLAVFLTALILSVILGILTIVLGY